MKTPHPFLSEQTIDQMQALYLHDLAHGATRAIQYKAADKLMALARFLRGGSTPRQPTTQGPSQPAPLPVQAPDITLPLDTTISIDASTLPLSASQALDRVRILAPADPCVRQLRSRYHLIENLGAVSHADYRFLEQAGLIHPDGVTARPTLQEAWMAKQPSA